MKIAHLLIAFSAFGVGVQVSSGERQTYQHGTISKIRTEVLSERRGGPVPPTAEEPRAQSQPPAGEIYYLHVQSGSATYVARGMNEGESCKAQDFAAGPVEFRLVGDKMFLKCPRGNGELETLFGIDRSRGRKLPARKNQNQKLQ